MLVGSNSKDGSIWHDMNLRHAATVRKVNPAVMSSWVLPYVKMVVQSNANNAGLQAKRVFFCLLTTFKEAQAKDHQHQSWIQPHLD